MLKKYAFTLAEIMIVLVVIGILTGILVPAAMNSMPNENVMKFKKAHNTLYRVINELVSSDKYYADGDLGIRPNGDLIDGTHTGDKTYFCKTFADIITTKQSNCTEQIEYGYTIASDAILKQEVLVDNLCRQKANSNTLGMDITTTDRIRYYTVGSFLFGASLNGRKYLPASLGENPRFIAALCIDVDGTPSEATSSDCINECPFGYAISADGKIYPGQRVLNWLEKSIQEE